MDKWSKKWSKKFLQRDHGLRLIIMPKKKKKAPMRNGTVIWNMDLRASTPNDKSCFKCIVSREILANESIKPSQLERHLTSKLRNIINNDTSQGRKRILVLGKIKWNSSIFKTSFISFLHHFFPIYIFEH